MKGYARCKGTFFKINTHSIPATQRINIARINFGFKKPTSTPLIEKEKFCEEILNSTWKTDMQTATRINNKT